MRKRNLYSAAYLMMGAAMAFTSCSNNDDVLNGNNGINGEEPVQTISLAVANSGDNFLGSRADRPLYSSEAKQDINKVKVVIYKVGDTSTPDEDAKAAIWGNNKEIVAVKTFDNWMNGGVSGEYNNATNGHGRQASWTLSSADLIQDEGKYIAYAIGYNDSEYRGTSWSSYTSADKGGELTFPINVDALPDGRAREIFAGASNVFTVTKTDQTVGGEEEGQTVSSYHFNAKITLHRQVAGAIGYFTNIPTKGNADHADKTGAKLRLVAAAKNTKAVFAGFNSEFKGEPATGQDALVKYVVNGTTTATADAKFYNTAENNADNDAFTVYEISLADWFKGTSMDTNEDGLLNELDTDWSNPYDGKANVAMGSVLAGKFLIPFEMVADKATFQLQMLDEDNNIIRYWNIRLPQSSDSQIGKSVTLVAEDGTETSASNTETNVNYSVVRNHIYSIGSRDNGDNPTEPGTDPDKPQDLNDETLVLRVNDNWEMIHHMEVD